MYVSNKKGDIDICNLEEIQKMSELSTFIKDKEKIYSKYFFVVNSYTENKQDIYRYPNKKQELRFSLGSKQNLDLVSINAYRDCVELYDIGEGKSYTVEFDKRNIDNITLEEKIVSALGKWEDYYYN